MTIDWFVLLTPLLLLVVLAPVSFVGCTPFGATSAPVTQPGPPLTIEEPGGPPPPPPPTPTTGFRLNMDPDLGTALGTLAQPVRITVVWRLEATAAGTTVPPTEKTQEIISRLNTPGDPAQPIDPVADKGVAFTVDTADLGGRDRVRLQCTVLTNSTLPISPPTVTFSPPNGVPIEKGKVHVFRIMGQQAGFGYTVFFDGA